MTLAMRAPGGDAAIDPTAKHDWKDGRLMIVLQPDTPGKARISGTLTGDGIRIVLDAVASGVAVFDVSEVDRVDDRAVRALAELSPARCMLEGCPRWLALWLERVRGAAGDAD